MEIGPSGGSSSASNSDPASDIFAVTESDATADPNGPFRGLVFGVAGAIKIQTSAGSTIVLPSGLLAVGIIHPIKITRVWSTGTTATSIYGVK